ncbi:hypothetical protein QJS10_CPA06g00835 [Acorus calamus]|uniref:Poly(A) polymerase n=1 Tax=Acorus calamus TaxID=4465 RepID=A0AAV9EPQ2_ACOCL|nr:hypothetical protein QJS10_CPA06g00835 [Acorus calamus]
MVESKDSSGFPLQIVKQYGVTKAISVAGPTEADLQRSLELDKFLVDSGLYESKDEAVKREEVLGQIDRIVKDWVKQLTRQRGYNEQMVEEANAVIFTFGSYRLGVHGPGADIDTLCVGPSYVNREDDFFGILHNILAETEEVTELQPVPDAHVPVMKFKFRGISIDLLYAKEDEVGFPVWDPRKNPRDRTHHMPIITPAYPCMNSSYNVSTSTLRVMMEQFEFGKKVCEEIELNKSCWGSLFEPYNFFSKYKNYLQVDIIAADTDDLLSWKGWVESRLRQLTLKIERDTFGMLQCHPYPNEYVDTSKQLCAHCAFFMGLQRKQGVAFQEGQQFDIRATVDEFRQSVNMYMYWKPGMEIYVSHVRKKQIPLYVYPEGYKRPSVSERRHKKKQVGEDDMKPNKLEKQASLSPGRQKSPPSDDSGKTETCSSEGNLKRKDYESSLNPDRVEKHGRVSPSSEEPVSPTENSSTGKGTASSWRGQLGTFTKVEPNDDCMNRVVEKDVAKARVEDCRIKEPSTEIRYVV